jgi:CxxC motif-containing protein (DUF1111 family)
MDQIAEIGARERAMSYAVQTAEIGECPMKILARAALYTDFMLLLHGDGTKLTDNVPMAVVHGDKLRTDGAEGVGDGL